MTRLILALAVALGCLLLPGAFSVQAEPQFPSKLSSRIVVSQDKQRMFIYQGDKVVREFPVSTGWPGVRRTFTPTWTGRVGEYWGTFSSFGTTQDLGYWLFTDYLPGGEWNGDILVHGAPYTLDGAGKKLYSAAQIGNSPASHGCIQLLPDDAQWFHEWDPVDVPITIEPFTGGILIYPKIVFGAQLTGGPLTQGQATVTPEPLATHP